MAIKHILVTVSGGKGDPSRLGVALALAQKHQAGVAALHVKPLLTTYAVGAGGEMPIALIEAQQRETEERASTVEATVRAEAKRAGIGIEWRSDEGNEAAHAGVQARYSDLIVSSPDLAHDLVFTSATPVLVVRDGMPSAAPRRVLVAWNGSREATHATRDAMPLMVGSETTVVLTVDAKEAIGPSLARSLTRHGIQTELREKASDGRDVGAVILEEATAAGCDLVVMGAYGHSRFREWVLGGATETVLREATIPILISH